MAHSLTNENSTAKVRFATSDVNKFELENLRMRNELEETKEQLEKLKLELKNISRHSASSSSNDKSSRDASRERPRYTNSYNNNIKNLTAAHLCLMRITVMDYASIIVTLETNLITVSHHATGRTSRFLVIIATILDIVSGISLYITQKTSRSRDQEE